LAAQQSGWLAASIKHGDEEREGNSRASDYINAGLTPPNIEIIEGGYLVSMLSDIGTIKQMPMGGFEAVNWSDIYPYIMLTVGTIEAWEARLIIEMSKAFLSGLSEGENPFSIPPIERD
jgi:hypothetical protein